MSSLILSNEQTITIKNKDNNNALIVGSPGTGKTRGHILPSLCQADGKSSFVVLDPKAEIYDMTHNMMRKKGYETVKVNFDSPAQSETLFNPLSNVKTEEDAICIATIMVNTANINGANRDLFWDRAAIMLLSSLIFFVATKTAKSKRNLCSVEKLLRAAGGGEIQSSSKLDCMFEDLLESEPDNFAAKQYFLCRQAAQRTWASVIISASSIFSTYMTKNIIHLTSPKYSDDESILDIKRLGMEPTILYVISSDVDRSRDGLINILFSQAYSELFRLADSMPNHSLPYHVHFFMDDLASNLIVGDLDKRLSVSRSRNISATVLLQSIGQLEQMYGNGATTAIINSCRGIVFMGGQDYHTCDLVAKMLDLPVGELLYMDNDYCYVFLQGERPHYDLKRDVTKEANYYMVDDFVIDDDLDIEK